MSAAVNWSSGRVVRTEPARVIDTLTDTDACARWSPVAFSLDDDGGRLRPGTTRRVSGRLMGARVRFHLHTLEADANGLRLHARGPVDLHVHYVLQPIASGCRMDAHVSIHPPRGHFGQLVAHAARSLLVAGTLDHALQRIAHEAERSDGLARRCEGRRRRSAA
jgi:hypothetical protein